MIDKKDNIEIEDIDCTEAIDSLYAYLDNEIDDAESIKKIEHHLEHCQSCFTRTQVESALTSHMQDAADKKVPESLQKRLRDIIEKF